MTVGQLKALINDVEDHRLVVGFAPGFGGLTESTVAYRERVGGLDHRFSTEEVDCLILANGDAGHMRAQGIDVLGTEGS